MFQTLRTYEKNAYAKLSEETDVTGYKKCNKCKCWNSSSCWPFQVTLHNSLISDCRYLSETRIRDSRGQ